MVCPAVGDGHREMNREWILEHVGAPGLRERLRIGRRIQPPDIGGIVRGHDPAIHDHRGPGVEARPGEAPPTVPTPAVSMTEAEPGLEIPVAWSEPSGQTSSAHSGRPSWRSVLPVRARPPPSHTPRRAGVVDPVAPIPDAIAIGVRDDARGDPLLAGIYVGRRPPSTEKRRPIRDQCQAGLITELHPSNVSPRVNIGSGVACRITVLVPLEGMSFIACCIWSEIAVADLQDGRAACGLLADRRGPVLLQPRLSPGQRTDRIARRGTQAWTDAGRRGSGTSHLAMPWRPRRTMGQGQAGRPTAAAGGRSPPPTPHRRAGLRPREASCRGPGRTVGLGRSWSSRAAGAASGRDP